MRLCNGTGVVEASCSRSLCNPDPFPGYHAIQQYCSRAITPESMPYNPRLSRRQTIHVSRVSTPELQYNITLQHISTCGLSHPRVVVFLYFAATFRHSWWFFYFQQRPRQPHRGSLQRCQHACEDVYKCEGLGLAQPNRTALLRGD